MNYFNLTTKTVMSCKEAEVARLAGSTDKVVSRHDFNSLQDAQDVVIAFEGTGVVLMATDLANGVHRVSISSKLLKLATRSATRTTATTTLVVISQRSARP